MNFSKMTNRSLRLKTHELFFTLMFTLTFAWISGSACDAQEKSQNPDNQTQATAASILLTGKVFPLSEVLKSRQVASEYSTFENVMVLLTDSGQAHLLLNDEGGRVLYVDEILRGKHLRIRIQPETELPVNRVIKIEMEVDGRWRIPEFYCDICTISVRYPQTCLCCQGPMVFRLRPER